MAAPLHLSMGAVARAFSLSQDSDDDNKNLAGANHLKLSLASDRSAVAVAHKNELACFALCPEEADQDDERRSSHALCSCSDAITDMVWVAFTAGGEGTCGSAAATPGSPSPPGAAAGADMCLLVGTAGGHLQIHSATGKLLLRQRLHASAVRRIRVRCWRQGCHPEPTEDVTVVLAEAVVRIRAAELRAALAACRHWAAQPHADSGAATVHPLDFQIWLVPGSVKSVSDGICLGAPPPDLYTLLQGVGAPGGSSGRRLVVVLSGERPCLAALDALEPGSEGARGALALLAGAASSLSSGVLGLARSAGSQVLAGPRALTSSIRSFVLNPLSLGWPPEAESTGGGTSAAGAACFDALPPAASAAAAAPVAHAFRDDPRVVTCCVAAPVGCMLAAADNLGRVLLANGATMTVLHMWKGYRDAQVGWLEVRQERAAAAATAAAEAAAQCASFGDDTSPRPSNAAAETETTPKEQRPLAGGKGRKGKGGQAGGDRPAPAARSSPAVTTSGGGGAAHVALLAVYAPKRQTLDVWEPCSGRLLATRLVGPNAQLLPTQLPLGASAADGLLEDCLGRLPTSCFVLEAGTGRLTDVADLLPALPAAAPKGSGGGGTGGE